MLLYCLQSGFSSNHYFILMRTARGHYSTLQWAKDQRRVIFQRFQWVTARTRTWASSDNFSSYWTNTPSTQLWPCANAQWHNGLPQGRTMASIVSHCAGSWHLMLNKEIYETNEQTGDKPRKLKSQLRLRLLWKKLSPTTMPFQI